MNSSGKDWLQAAETVSDEQLSEFRQRICVQGGHVGLPAIGTCNRCRGATSCCNMKICENCAQMLGVCPYDERMDCWGAAAETDPETHAILWLALLMRGYSLERQTALGALKICPYPDLIREAMEWVKHPAAKSVNRSPVAAEFIVGFHKRIPAELTIGAAYLNGEILRRNEALGFLVVRVPNAAEFEALISEDSRVRYAELNRS